MLNLLSSLLNAITGGTSNIFMKLISMLGMGIFWKWFKGEEEDQLKKEQEAKLDSDINKSNAEAGKNAEKAKKYSEINEEYIKQKRIINKMKLESRVKIIAPDNIKTGESFIVEFKGIPTGTNVLMDNKWNMGRVNSQGYLKMIVNTAGKRTLNINIGDYKFSKDIEVK